MASKAQAQKFHKAAATTAGAVSSRKPKKADIIEAAVRAGVPTNRLTGTIPEIQAEVRSYLEAQAEAAVDVADAAFAPQERSATATQPQQSGMHPMNGLYIGGAIATLWHFLS